jgi:cell division septal protein FtsQ
MERDTKIKIFGTAFFIVLITGLIYLIYQSNKIKKTEAIETIFLKGNNLLTENDYLSFTKLDDISQYQGITLSLIKDRFEKHPYILKADVRFVNEKEVEVFIFEKKIYGLVIKGTEPLFVSENFEILPVITNAKIVDVPVLSNVREIKELKPLSIARSEDILQAFKIIDAARFTNIKLFKGLAEINLRNGGDVILMFSGLNTPVIFGRGSEAVKAVYLEAILSGYFDNNTFIESSYIDLRFKNGIYVGKMKKTEF